MVPRPNRYIYSSTLARKAQGLLQKGRWKYVKRQEKRKFSIRAVQLTTNLSHSRKGNPTNTACCHFIDWWLMWMCPAQWEQSRLGAGGTRCCRRAAWSSYGEQTRKQNGILFRCLPPDSCLEFLPFLMMDSGRTIGWRKPFPAQVDYSYGLYWSNKNPKTLWDWISYVREVTSMRSHQPKRDLIRDNTR